jgi:hypothetical protein
MKIVVALYAWIQTGRFPPFFGEKDHLHNGHKCKMVLPLDSNGFFTYISMSVFMSTCLSFSFDFFSINIHICLLDTIVCRSEKLLLIQFFF